MQQMPAAQPVRAPAPLVTFVIDGDRYAVLLTAVERILPMLRPVPLPGAPAIVLGVVNVGGRIVPVLDIRHRLGRPPRRYGVAGRILVARTVRWTVALPADDVPGVIEVPADAIVPGAAVGPSTPRTSGIVALADGLLFIQDLESFLFPEEEQALAHAIETFPS